MLNTFFLEEDLGGHMVDIERTYGKSGVVNMKNVMWLNELSKSNLSEVGGKGANLGEMYNAGFPIPNAFVVTSGAYFKYIKANGIDRLIKEVTNGLDVENTDALKVASEKIKSAILQGNIPQDIVDSIVGAYRQLGDDKFVAVRSSATAEDLPEASFAGQQETYLNVRGEEAVLSAVKRCWASLFGERAIYYRQQNGFDHARVGLAAVVQEMVESQVSGIMFTVEPVSQNRNLLSIEAAFGLGEVVVSGAVTPDRYIVDKRTLEIKSKQINKQTWTLVLHEGENVEVDIKKEKQQEQKLRDDLIIALAKLGIKIENHYGKPQDIEWGMVDDQLYIVQSRPITTLREDLAGAEEVHVESTTLASAEVLVKGLGASPGLAWGTVKVLAGPQEIGKVKKGDILVAKMTTPDYVPAMKKAAAIVTDEGGATCHAAIVSREMGIPCVVGTGNATTTLREGDVVTVDAIHGVVYNGKVEELIKEEKQVTDHDVKKAEQLEYVPVTGTKIYVNLAEVELAEKVAKLPVDGVGLLRAEFMIADIGVHPRKLLEEGRGHEFTDKLAEGLRKFAAAFYPRPVVYRATDFKTNEYRNLEGGEKYEPIENNPMIGYRGCSRYVAEPDVFKLELDAIRKVREEYGMKNLWLMIPFVRDLHEFTLVKKLVEEAGLKRSRDFKLWIMVEVPSTVILIDEFIEAGIDGVSIGSNDLTQLILGIDRDNAILAKEFDERNPAVFKAIKHVIERCNAKGVTVSICGQAPSVYPEVAEKLVEYGITSLSVNPDVVIRTRQLVAAAEQKILLKRLRALYSKVINNIDVNEANKW